jgi:NSS family neurotransmitter:Na+ symporter
MGPGLVFVTLPIAFGQMPMGHLIGVLFFLMLFIAALTSAISLSEPAIAWLTEKFAVSRAKAALISGALLWLLSIGSVLSFNAWSELTLHGKTFFDCMDYLTANLLMPLGGLMTVLFSGWVLNRTTVQQAMGIAHPQLFQLCWYVLRWLTPLGILLVFLHAIGLFD